MRNDENERTDPTNRKKLRQMAFSRSHSSWFLRTVNSLAFCVRVGDVVTLRNWLQALVWLHSFTGEWSPAWPIAHGDASTHTVNQVSIGVREVNPDFVVAASVEVSDTQHFVVDFKCAM